MYLYSCAALLVFVLALSCFPPFIIYIIPRGRVVCLIGHLVLNTISSNIRFTFQNIRNGIDFLADLLGIVPFLFLLGIFLIFAFLGKNSVFFCFTGEQIYIDIYIYEWMDR